MKHLMVHLMLALFAALPLSACAFDPLGGQAGALARLKAMDAEDYFQGEAQVALAEAAGRGDIERMRAALADGAKVDQVGRDGMTPIFWAAGIKHNLEGFRFLLEQGADPDTATRQDDDSEKTAILEIAYYLEDPRYMKALLEHGADPNAMVDGPDGTALFLPIPDRRLAHIELLVEYGTDVNHRAEFNYTPLLRMVYGDEYKTALFLLRAGADPTIENTRGSSAISVIKKFHERTKKYKDEGSGYPQLIEALKQRGYLDEDF